VLIIEGLVTVYGKYMPLVNCTVIYTDIAVLIADMAVVLQLYQWKTQMLCICGIYAWLGRKNPAVYLRAIHYNIVAIFIVSICCV